MRRLPLLLWVGFMLTGCLSPSSYGYLVKGTVPPQMPEQLAQDTVTRMEAVYPPAHTRLALTHPATDPYGVALIEALRRKGYGVIECVDTHTSPSTRDEQHAHVEHPAVSHDEGMPFRYVVDGPFDQRLYRVTVFIGHQSLSRAYHMDEHTMTQAGAWVRKE